ncbi:MAG: hypothetical protein WAM76_05380, partial [Pseudolabrys sp.]
VAVDRVRRDAGGDGGADARRGTAAICAGSSLGHVWTAPAVQEKSDVSAKRSGAAMYPAYFRLEDYLCRDAATVAAGPDVIR